jgi:hypothetical protein
MTYRAGICPHPDCNRAFALTAAGLIRRHTHAPARRTPHRPHLPRQRPETRTPHRQDRPKAPRPPPRSRDPPLGRRPTPRRPRRVHRRRTPRQLGRPDPPRLTPPERLCRPNLTGARHAHHHPRPAQLRTRLRPLPDPRRARRRHPLPLRHEEAAIKWARDNGWQVTTTTGEQLLCTGAPSTRRTSGSTPRRSTRRSSTRWGTDCEQPLPRARRPAPPPRRQVPLPHLLVRPHPGGPPAAHPPRRRGDRPTPAAPRSDRGGDTAWPGPHPVIVRTPA